jgi:hypothetical protein
MAEMPKKGAEGPMSTTRALDQLQQVQELNRVFLELLQERVRGQRGSLGLPPGVGQAIAIASGPLLDGVAGFPRALFYVDVGSQSRPTCPDADFDEAEHHVCLSVLFAARHTSRQSTYQARLLFGLEAAEVERLRSALLPDLQQLACTPGVLKCAFRERHWFWHGLFTATRPELRRQLTLMALQPGIAVGWPLRRPAQPTA